MRYPVHFQVVGRRPADKAAVLLRILALVLLGVAGLSLAGLFVLAYLALPLIGEFLRPATDEAKDLRTKQLTALLRWAAAATSWLGLAVEELPETSPQDTIDLSIDPTATHDRAPALLPRLLTGLPSALGLAVLCLVGGVVWLWAALSILMSGACPDSAHRYLVGLQRYAYRLLCFQAGLVDEVPPFALSDDFPTSGWSSPSH